MGNSEESVYDALLCDRIPAGSPRLGPYVSQGPRIVLIFSSMEREQSVFPAPHGFRFDDVQNLGIYGAFSIFRARIEFKTGLLFFLLTKLG